MKNLPREYVGLVSANDSQNFLVLTFDRLNKILAHFGHAPVKTRKDLERRYGTKYGVFREPFYFRLSDEVRQQPNPWNWIYNFMEYAEPATVLYPLVEFCRDCNGYGIDSETDTLCSACGGRGGFTETPWVQSV